MLNTQTLNRFSTGRSMRKLEEIRILLQDHLFSVNRRRFTKILVKEWFMGLAPLSKKNKAFALDLPSDPPADTWTSHEFRAIDASYFKRGTAKLVEDRVLHDGHVHANYDYTVQQLNGASTYTNEAIHRSVFTRTGERIELFSSERRLAGVPICAPSRQKLSASKTLSGVTANLYGTTVSADGNYYHWFVDTLARLFLIERFHSLDKIDHILVPPLKYDFHLDSLAVFGFDQSRIFELHPLECVQCESLLATSPPRGKGSSIVPCLLYTSPSPRDKRQSRMPSSA